MSESVSDNPLFGLDKVLRDKLFSKHSVRAIAAANIREKEKFSRISRSLEKEREARSAELDTTRKALKKKTRQLRKRVRETRQYHTVDETGSDADTENQSTDEDEDEKADDTRFLQSTERLQQSVAESGRKRDYTLGSIDKEYVFLPPLAEQEMVAYKDRSDTWRSDVSRPRNYSKSSPARLTQTRGQSIRKPHLLGIAEERRGSTAPAAAVPTDILNEDDISRLTLRLHRSDTSITNPELMTENELKIYNFLQRMNGDKEEKVIDVPLPQARRDVNRVYSDDPLRRLSMAFAAGGLTSFGSRQSSRATYHEMALKSLLPPSRLPPIYCTRPVALAPRDWEREIPRMVRPLRYEDLRYCRYLRVPPEVMKRRTNTDDKWSSFNTGVD